MSGPAEAVRAGVMVSVIASEIFRQGAAMFADSERTTVPAAMSAAPGV